MMHRAPEIRAGMLDGLKRQPVTGRAIRSPRTSNGVSLTASSARSFTGKQQSDVVVMISGCVRLEGVLNQTEIPA